MVEVQKLLVFCDSCGARATLCGDRRGRGEQTDGFLRLLPCARARPCAAGIDVVDAHATTGLFCVFLRDPLRGSCVSDRSRYGPVVRARPCEGIVRVRSLSVWSCVTLRISSRSARPSAGTRLQSQLSSTQVVCEVRAERALRQASEMSSHAARAFSETTSEVNVVIFLQGMLRE